MGPKGSDKTRAVEISSPGRLCLFGEHSDWAAEYGVYRGHCIVVGTDQCIRARVQPSDVFHVETWFLTTGAFRAGAAVK